jgi:hypothetical protein
MRSARTIQIIFVAAAALAFCGTYAHAQAALLMEEPYGVFGLLNPTGHNALYFEHICAETPVKLRRCEVGESGSVIARNQGISGYDWIAIPLLPYLYAVENASEVPARADRKTVTWLRKHYREAHLLDLGENLPAASFWHGGWTGLVGSSYERRIYAFRFYTTEEQDNAFITRMNADNNSSHFELFYNNCADFSRQVLNFYFPGTFRRSVFPDAGMTTPKQTAHKLVRYASKHPETQLEVFEIPQIPGYRHHSHSNDGVAESLTTTAYAVPIAVFAPYIAGGIFADYLARGRFRIVPKHPTALTPETLYLLAQSTPKVPASTQQGSSSSVTPSSPSIAKNDIEETPLPATANSTQKQTKDAHE